MNIGAEHSTIEVILRNYTIIKTNNTCVLVVHVAKCAHINIYKKNHIPSALTKAL